MKFERMTVEEAVDRGILEDEFAVSHCDFCGKPLGDTFVRMTPASHTISGAGERDMKFHPCCVDGVVQKAMIAASENRVIPVA